MWHVPRSVVSITISHHSRVAIWYDDHSTIASLRNAGARSLLRVYVSAACASCATAYERVAQVRQLRPHQRIEVVDLDQAGTERPSTVFGTPTYCLGNRVISLGNLSLPALLAELDRATAPPSDRARSGGVAPWGRG